MDINYYRGIHYVEYIYIIKMCSDYSDLVQIVPG